MDQLNQDTIKASLTQIVGSENIIDTHEIIEQYALDVGGSRLTPYCIVKPKSEKEIVSIVILANEVGLELYPICAGKNWGYGTAQGTKQGQIILDLSLMNQITAVNTELCYMKIQPGVTQWQAYTHLSQIPNCNVQLDVTGAGKDASIIGNILERGFGHTDYGNRYEHVINLTIVMPNGQIIKTGFGSYADADATDTFRYGVGPCLEGLFTQSNFGIITEMTLQLMPKPEKFCTLIGSLKQPEAITELVVRLRKLHLDGIITGVTHIANKNRAIGTQSASGINDWIFNASLSGSKPIVVAKKKVIKSSLKKRGMANLKLVFITDKLFSFISYINKKIYKLPFYELLKSLIELQKGIPTNDPLKVLVNKENLSTDDLKTSAFPLHFKWICAVCSADKHSIQSLLNLLTGIFQTFGYEFRITMSFIDPRNLIFITNISYEKEDEAITKANMFYEQCTNLMKEKGFYPYRSGSGTYKHLPEYRESVAELLKKIKTSIDPNNIIAPKKYNI